MEQDVSLLISVPSCRDWKPQFGASMCGLVQELFKNGLGGRLKTVELSTKFQASCLSEVREDSLNYAEKEGFTHWLSLDDDMMFPSNVVERLLKHDKPVVCANYRRKQAEVRGICLDLQGQYLNSAGKTGIEEVAFIGGGCNLFHVQSVSVVRPPRFSVLYLKDRQAYMSEDYYFSTRLREAGIKLYVDHDVSQEVQHVGDVAYKFPEVQ